MTEPAANSKEPSSLGVLLLTGILVVGFFLPTLSYEVTNWDDVVYLTHNPYIRGANIQNALGVFRESYFANYHPLTMLSYMLDWQIAGGLSASVVRMQNILWHAGAAVLLAGLLLEFGVCRIAACGLAIWWGVHPSRYESVLWLSERKDVLSVFFALAAMLVHVRAREVTGSAWWKRWFPLETAFVLLSLLSKSMIVTWPALMLAYDAILHRDVVRKRFSAYAAWGVLSALFMILNLRAQTSSAPDVGDGSLISHAIIIIQNVAWHPMKMLFPSGLAPLHPRPEFATEFAAVALSLLAIVLLSVAAFATRRRAPIATFGIAFYAIALSPVSGVLPLGYAWVADRYGYLPSVGLVIALGMALMAIKNTNLRMAAPMLALAALLFFEPTKQMQVWRNSETLWRRVLTVYPGYREAELQVARHIVDTTGRSLPADELAQIPDRFGYGWRDDLLLRALLREGRIDEAEALVSKFSSPILQTRARIQLALARGDRESAARLTGEIVDGPAVTVDDLAAMAQIEMDEKDPWGAMKVIARAPRPSLQLAGAHGRLAVQFAAEGSTVVATGEARKAELIDPSRREVIAAYVAIFASANDAKGGADYLDEVLTRRTLPDDSRLFAEGRLGLFLAAAGESELAMPHLKSAFALGSTDLAPLRALRSLLATRNDEAEFLATVDRRIARLGGK
jgi:hypothetical protein